MPIKRFFLSRSPASFFFIVFLFTLLTVVSPRHAYAAFTYVKTIGVFGTSTGQIDLPFGEAFDSSGNMYITDLGNNDVQEYNSSGVYQSQFSTPSPYGITISTTTGYIYVVNNSGEVSVFNSSHVLQATFGSYGSSTGQFNRPTGITLDSSGNIYVADQNNNRIEVFNPDYSYKTSFGTLGSGNNNLNQPQQIAFSSINGDLYVADSQNHRVMVFNTSGVYQWQFGAYGQNGVGDFVLSTGIALDSSGNIYVSDWQTDLIQVFNASGTFQTQFGGGGSGDGTFKYPYFLAIDSSSNIYVADEGNGDIQEFSAPSSKIQTVVTSAATSIASTTITLNGQISDIGYGNALQSGFVYATTSNLSNIIATTTLGNQFGTSTFASIINGLTPNTLYYFQAYTTNQWGTAYGSILSATTSALVPPIITTQTVSNINATSVKGNGTVVSIGGGNITSIGFVYGTTTTYSATTTSVDYFGVGVPFDAEINGLNCNTVYHIATYATNAYGIEYGPDTQFTTGPCVSSIPATSDEFIGPFSSWVNIKSFGATGDGVTDDTAAIQAAFNTLTTSAMNNKVSPVLYFPAGTYKITSTLNLYKVLSKSIIGQDPSLVSIVWAGAASGTMIDANGMAKSKISRITFDGKSTALIAVDQAWDQAPGNYFDTGNEYSDDTFLNTGYGIRGGELGGGFAETSIERDHFINNWVGGIIEEDFNALDLWVWYSTFQNCGFGVSNYPYGGSGAGNYHVYDSVFSSSTYADMAFHNAGQFSIRNNYSVGSNQFLLAGSGYSGSGLDVTNNTVLDPTNTAGTAIVDYNFGPTLLLGNTFRINSNSPGPVVTLMNNVNNELESINNVYTISNDIQSALGQFIETGDQVVSYNSINVAPPVLPATLPNLNRQIFEVATGSNAVAIQAVINSAYLQNGNRPVVHFPFGTYNINQTIIIPPSDIQIVGDGEGIGGTTGGSILNWSGPGTSTGSVFQINGPSKVTLRDIGFNGNATAVVVNNIDQVGSRVYMDQFKNGGEPAFFVNGLDNTYVEGFNQGVGSVVVTGGPIESVGGLAQGKVDIFSGSGGSNYLTNGSTFDVSGGGKLLVQDFWNDSGSGLPTVSFADAHGRAQLTLDEIVDGQTGFGTPTVIADNLIGTTTVLTSFLGPSDGITISGDGSNASVLGMGITMGSTTPYFSDTSSPSAHSAELNVFDYLVSGLGPTVVPNIGSVDTSFIENALEQDQNDQPQALSALPSGVSDVRLFRVTVPSNLSTSSYGIILQGTPQAPALTISAASSITATGAVLNGAIAFDGYSSSTVEGFNYGPTISYGSVISTTGSFDLGSFSQTVGGLSCSTTYHFQAFATNASGTGASADNTFTTPSCSSPDIISGGGGGGGGGSFAYTLIATTTGSGVGVLSSTPTGIICGEGSNYCSDSFSGDSTVVLTASSQAGSHLVSWQNCTSFTSSTCTVYLTTTETVKADFEIGASTIPVVNTTSLSANATQTTMGIIPTFNLNLSFGSTGPQVTNLQTTLTNLGFYKGPVTGYFGSLTESAVEKYQLSQGISPVGFVGPATRSALNLGSSVSSNVVMVPTTSTQTSTSFSSVTFTRNLFLGSVGLDVRLLQQKLNALGFTVALSGNGSLGNETTYFGRGTELALENYQCSVNIVCSGTPYSDGFGLFGVRTRAVLTGQMKPPATLLIKPVIAVAATSSSATITPVVTSQVTATAKPVILPTSVATTSVTIKTLIATTTVVTLPPFTQPLQIGSTGEEVKNLQIFLNTHGFVVAPSGPESPGHETTTYDALTAAAVANFQQAHAAEILTPYGLTEGTGSFGETTMGVVNGIEGE